MIQQQYNSSQSTLTTAYIIKKDYKYINLQ